MIEIKNLVKTYCPKKGVPVKAINDVSLTFEETGMVFILGKSGSGKSTLLNLMGGLDRYDDGEIIIKGKSSKDFSQAEFDSYRNTYVGFIFQEYNILDEFSVGANIALAMELQGKKANTESLNALLDTVDLTGYANRKPNELSGGQKQRVAIARALIKEPEIIMADEPTGALDSNTGKQVFETLQKLSKTKLVIIVSHDREFAEYYGDRVIEFADGKVISDIYKYTAQSESKSEGLSIIDDKILHIKKGYSLTAKDLDMINSYLKKNSSSDTIISLDDRSNVEFKRLSRINEDGNKDAFKDTTDSDIDVKAYGEKDFKLIKSKLPLRNALKIGASSLKVKPFRLMMTILLSAVALCLFGIAFTAGSYNKIDASVRSIQDANINYVALSKTLEIDKGDYTYSTEKNLSNKDVEKLKKDFPNQVFSKMYGKDSYSFSNAIYDSTLLGSNSYSSYYMNSFSGIVEINSTDISKLGFNLLAGRMPTADREIVITKYTYEVFAKAGFKGLTTADNVQSVTSPTQLIDKKLYIGYDYVEYTIVGVLDTKFDSTRYEALKNPNTSTTSASDYMLLEELRTVVSASYHNALIMKEGTIEALVSESEAVPGLDLYGNDYNVNLTDSESFGVNISKMVNFDYAKSSALLFSPSMTSLGENEILFSLTNAVSMLEQKLTEGDRQAVENNFNNYINTKITDEVVAEINSKLAAKGEVITLTKEDVIMECGNFNSLVFYSQDHSRIPQDVFDMGNLYREYSNSNTFREVVLPKLKNNVGNYTLSYNLYNSDTSASKTVTVVGFVNDVGLSINDKGNSFDVKLVCLSDSYYDLFDIPTEYYNYLLGSMPTDEAEIRALIEYTYTKQGDIYYNLNNAVTTSLVQINEMIEMFAEVFVYIGIGFAVFAAIMLMNYIATSISYKKREIGILRAVGARSNDVFNIFFDESLIIALINFFVALACTIVAVTYINSYFKSALGILITIMNFGVIQIALMLAISVVSAFIASFIPILTIARKRPIEAIRGR